MEKPKLSYILPYFKKFREFSLALPLNAHYLENPDYEVILVLDEPSEEKKILNLIKEYSKIKWRVIINDSPHSWRTPCKAQNVGIRNALGDFVLLGDPESVFVSPMLDIALEKMLKYDHSFVIGRVAFGPISSLKDGTSSELNSIFNSIQSRMSVPLFYCSICARREDMIAIKGYDERLIKWGADDDNLRLRLMMSGIHMLPVPEIKLLHFSYERRKDGHASRYVPRYTKEEKRVIENPKSIIANKGKWGEDFNRIAYDWYDNASNLN